MKSLKKNHILSLVGIFLVGVVGLRALGISQAATGSLVVSPSSQTVEKSKSVTVQMRVSTSADVAAADLNLSYDTAKLKYKSHSTSGSPLTSGAGISASISGGNVHLVRLSTGSPASGNFLVASVTFTALVSSGSANLQLTGDVAEHGTNDPVSVSNGNASVSFKAAPTSGDDGDGGGGSTSGGGGGNVSDESCPSGQTGTPPNCKKSSTTANDSEKPVETQEKNNPKAPKVVVKEGDIQFKKATIALTSEKPVKVTVKYGIGDKLTSNTKTTDYGTSHKLSLNKVDLIPGTTYSYSIVATDKAGNVTTTPIETFKTKGYTVRVRVLDSGNRPLKNKEVTLFSDPIKSTTDSDGIAEFNDVSPGQHEVVYADDDTSYKKVVIVEDNVTVDAKGVETATPQNAAVVYEEYSQPQLNLVTILLGMLAILGVFVLVRSGRLKRFKPSFARNSHHSTTSAFDTPVSSEQPPSSAPQSTIDKINGPEKHQPGAIVQPDEKEKS